MREGKTFLAIDCGAGTLKVGEFEVTPEGDLRLCQFGIKPLGPEGGLESKREATLAKALKEILTELGIKTKPANICAPSFTVFTKFTKLPPVETGKIAQMVKFEAQQNVPFPLEECVWDYQILGTTGTEEFEILLVAARRESIDSLYRCVDNNGLRLQLVDASPAALYNAVRYNYPDLEGCTLLIDIGAKTTNILLFEKDRFFHRAVNIGANTITQEFASEVKLPWQEAERFKISEGFVGLGGAYEEPENPKQAALSKIARQFMTRLHIQINQTIQYYRTQHGGSQPQRVLLAGGASIMTYTPQFFAEKMALPVEYFNPFRNLQIAPDVNIEALSTVAHSFGEVVGLALRNIARCPVELNLMPPALRRWQEFNEKKPYFMAALISLSVVVFLLGVLLEKLARGKREELAELKKVIEPLQRRETRFRKEMDVLNRLRAQADQLTTWLEYRCFWIDLCSELRQILMKIEAEAQQQFRVPAGIWVERLAASPARIIRLRSGGGLEREGLPWELRMRMGPEMDLKPPEAVPQEQPLRAMGYEQGMMEGAPPPQLTEISSNEVSTLIVVCRAVSLQDVDPSANVKIAHAFLRELKSSRMTDSEGTDFLGNLGSEEADGTFAFTVNWKLKKPLQLGSGN
jgi:type IV pilus assembly protein PilM